MSIVDKTHRLNTLYAKQSPEMLLSKVANDDANFMLTSKFGPLSAALIDIVVRVMPSVSLVWINTGFNTPDTLRHQEHICSRFKLQVHIYEPQQGLAAFYQSKGIPTPDTKEFQRFQYEMKIEPFQRALNDIQPDYWITGIRRQQTIYRRTLAPFTPYNSNVIRVSPFLNLIETDIKRMIAEKNLPCYDDYIDVTKPAKHRECGLQYARLA